jgi:hypothetical protein
MGTPEDIQKALHQGAGIEAEILGQKFNVYRNKNLLIPEFPIVVKRTNSRTDIEAAISFRNIVLVELTMDGSEIKVGDELVGVDDPNDRYFVASMRPRRHIIGFRAESLIVIRRPTQPVADSGDIDPYSQVVEAENYKLTYDQTTDLYSFQEPDEDITDAVIHAGVSQVNYTGSTTPFKLPTDTRTTRWVFVLPILAGVTLQEGDIVTFNGDDFMVYGVDKQSAFFNGQLLSADLLRP